MDSTQTAIRCSIIRGGTSRGAYFLADDLPGDEGLRDRVLLAVMGGPDALQVDGIGGGHPLTSKVAIVGPSAAGHSDVDYLFLQVSPQQQTVSAAQNCGNILAGVGAFAIDNALVRVTGDTTVVRVRMVNSDSLCELLVPTGSGAVRYDGDTAIDGVPGTAAAVTCNFLDTAGSASGALLPTGNVCDRVAGVNVTLIDNGMPVAAIRAADVGISGYEPPEALDGNATLKAMLERIRLAAGPMMNLGDVTGLTVPKLCLVAEPATGGHVCTRFFIPRHCHRSIGVLGAVTIATACVLPGSVAHGLAELPPDKEKCLSVEHPSGSITVRLVAADRGPGVSPAWSAGVIRTARTLMRGCVFVPATVWAGAAE